MFEGDEAEDLVTIVVCHDANEAALLKGLLEDHGIVVATPGLEHRSMLGMAGSFVKIPIKVPRRDKAEAEALLEALNEGGEDEDEDDDEAPEESPRRRRIAIFVACVLTFGSGHFYVRENAAGLVLALVEAVAIAMVCAGEPLVGVTIFGCVIADILGSFRAVARQEAGEDKLSSVAQVARTFPAITLASALALGVLHVLPEEEEPEPAYAPLPMDPRDFDPPVDDGSPLGLPFEDLVDPFGPGTSQEPTEPAEPAP